MNTLVNALDRNAALTVTLNGAPTYKTSGSKTLDLFGMGGSLRTRNESEIENLVSKAFDEDALLALKTIFWIRDIRGGAGERRTFRVALKWLANNYPSIARKNLVNVAEYGRFDDLFVLVGTDLEADLVSLIQDQIVKDLVAEHPSLMAKWLPSINTSSNDTKRLAKKLAKGLGLTERNYRRVLSRLRGKINIVESKMTAKEWDSINFEHVPSKASMNYRKAFRKHSPELYEQYIKAVEKGEKKINASALLPYELIREVYPLSGNYGYYYTKKLETLDSAEIRTLDAQWNALPNYFAGADNESWLAVVDVSGSMMCNNGLPMYTSIGLGIYCAERAKGPFHNKYITFDSTPKFLTVTGKNIAEKVAYTKSEGVGTSTNIQAVFDLILSTGVSNRVPQSDMPKRLVIITDTEFNHPQIGSRNTNFEVIKAKYAAVGYEMPELVFWNVNSVKDSSPVRVDDSGVVLVSGQSPSIFKNLLAHKSMDPYSMFLETVTGERYEKVVI